MAKKTTVTCKRAISVMRRAADRLDELAFKYDSQFEDMREEASVIRHTANLLEKRS